jgi:exodeoxyribonuclease V beta subunit
MNDFDLIASPLEGNNLIEASAGTGKTYTIAGLFVRLVVEKALFVDEILVVTYTVAATEELKDRIRRKLRETLRAFSTGQAEDSFLQGLLEKYPDGMHRIVVSDRLAMAIRNFDEAAIYTIHGFCQRMLHECAFESRFLFDTQLVTDQQRLKEEVIQDFWRRHFYDGIPELVGYALTQGYSPESFLKLFGREISNPDIKVIPEDYPPSLESIKGLVDAFHAEFEELKNAWVKAKEEVRECLKYPGLKANIYGARVDYLIAFMDRVVTSSYPFLALSSDFEKFTAIKIATSTKKSSTPPEHPVFQICERLKSREYEAKAQMDRYLLFLKAKLIKVINAELPALKQKKNVLFYDDLLIKFRTALEENGGVSLAEVIRGKYRAALIDEFQDTDPIQYAIFHMIFGADKKSESILFLIGDPKQAIYSFRGADLFAYIKAASNVDHKYTLRQNWRSVPDLVWAINTLFSSADRPFVHKEILFYPVQGNDRPELPGLTIDEKVEAAFQWWFVPAGPCSNQDAPLAKDQAKQLIAGTVAAEIARLIFLGRNKRAWIGHKPLAEKDIAVLVRTNREALQMGKALKELKISCVLYSTENLFDSKEAGEVERLLMGIAYMADERRFKAALVTSLIGVSGNELDRLEDDDSQWAVWLQRFKSYHDLWSTRGFIVMFRMLLDRENVRSRLLDFPDGERRLTNVLHLAEVLHHETLDRNLGMSGLLKWLARQRNPETPRKEEHQLRLESDEYAVRIATIHKSKGLEYPVVFCPFSWEGSRIGKDKHLTFHDPKNDYRLTYELGSSDLQTHKKWAEEELLAENMRLLYVALTRAKYRCYFVWGRFKDSETSAPAYLFHGSGLIEHDMDEMAACVKNLSDEAMYGELIDVACEGKGSINLCELPASKESIPISRQTSGSVFHCREFEGTIDRSWQVMSFSSLVSRHPQKVDFPDWDATEDVGAIRYQRAHEKGLYDLKPGVFTLPGGVHTGSLLHDILQHFDFTEEDQILAEALVAGKLEEYGFDSKWVGAIVEMLGNVMRSRIDPQDNSFTLSSLSNQDRINELEFYFPLEGLSWDLLWHLLDAHGVTWLSRETTDIVERLSFDPVRGFMKGFIDMVFCYKGRYYIVDWKSNNLGDQKENYGQEAMLSIMKNSFYLFQSFLYTVALHQYLNFRIPGYHYDIHFGGVYYLFLRGINPAWGTDYGIYRDKPRGEVINVFCRQFIKKS